MTKRAAPLIAIILFLLPALALQAATVRGVVVGPTGKPVSGAQLRLVGALWGDPGKALADAVSGADGKFALSSPGLKASILWPSYYVVARTSGAVGVVRVINLAATQKVVCAPAISVSGTVKDASGRPLQGYRVAPVSIAYTSFYGQRLISYRVVGPETPTCAGVTGADGKFTISGLPSGSLVTEVAISNPSGAEFVRSAPSAARPLAPGIPHPSLDLTLDRADAAVGSLAGTLTGVDGKPLAGVRVGAVRLSAQGASVAMADTRVLTDEAGRFRFDHLLPGIYSVSAVEPPAPVAPRQDAQVRANSTATVDLGAEKGAPVTGSVLDASTGKPVDGAIVYALGSASVTTAKDGRFSLRALPGAGAVIVRKDGYPDANQEITVPADTGLIGVVLKLERRAFAGRILTSGKAGADGALVKLLLPKSPTSDVQADALGNYLAAVDPSEVPPSGKVGVLALNERTGESGYVVVKPTGAVTAVNVRLAPPASVTGRVFDTSGAPIAGVRVTPSLAFGAYSLLGFQSETFTDVNGRFTVKGLVVGAEQALTFVAPGYELTRVSASQMPKLTPGRISSVDAVMGRSAGR